MHTSNYSRYFFNNYILLNLILFDEKRIKPLVCYLFTGFDKSKSFFNFINNYKKYNSGYNHDLFICYKLLNNKRINILENKIKKIKHKVFIDLQQIMIGILVVIVDLLKNLEIG